MVGPAPATGQKSIEMLTRALPWMRARSGARRLYLINSPVVRAEPLRFKEEGVRNVIKDVFLPWFNAYRFFVQNAKRMEKVGAMRQWPPFCGSLFHTLTRTGTIGPAALAVSGVGPDVRLPQDRRDRGEQRHGPVDSRVDAVAGPVCHRRNERYGLQTVVPPSAGRGSMLTNAAAPRANGFF